MSQRKSREFRRNAVERMKNCENVVALAKELGVSRRRLYKWKDQQAAMQGNEEIPAAVQSRISKLEQENNRLKKLVADHALERDFFKGALEKVGAIRQKESDSGEQGFMSRSEKSSTKKEKG